MAEQDQRSCSLLRNVHADAVGLDEAVLNLSHMSLPFRVSLVLQLSLSFSRRTEIASFPVAYFRDGLMHTAPERPSEDGIESDSRCQQQTADEMADLAHAEIDQRPRRRVSAGSGW